MLRLLRIVGTIPNGYTATSSAGTGGGGTGISTAFRNDEWWGGSNTNNVGQGWIKISIKGSVLVVGNGPGIGNPVAGETNEVANGQYSNSNVMAVQEADGSYAWISYQNPANGQYALTTSGIMYESDVHSWADPVLGSNPGQTLTAGHQFLNSTCWYDTPPSGQSHALTHQCLNGSPTNTGSSAFWEYDSWSGAAWVTEFRVTSTGTISGSAAASITSLSANNTFSGTETFNGAVTINATSSNRFNMPGYQNYGGGQQFSGLLQYNYSGTISSTNTFGTPLAWLNFSYWNGMSVQNPRPVIQQL